MTLLLTFIKPKLLMLDLPLFLAELLVNALEQEVGGPDNANGEDENEIVSCSKDNDLCISDDD